MNEKMLSIDSLNQLYDEISGQDVFILAGGPSIKKIDLSIIKHKKIIAINNSYQLFENITALYWCDVNWADEHYNKLERYPCKLRFTNRRKAKVDNRKGQSGATVLNMTGDFGYDPDITCVRGNNGGGQCLNLIINIKPSRIFLLGYDMQCIDGNAHWHKGHTFSPDDKTVYANRFIPSIVSMAEELKNYNNIPEIINLSPTSALSCFKIDNFDNYIEEFKDS